MQHLRRFLMIALLLCFGLLLNDALNLSGQEGEDGMKSPSVNYQSETAFLSNRYTQVEKDSREATNPRVMVTEEYQLFSDQEDYAYYVNSSDLSLRIVDKQTGYTWGSSLVHENDLNKTWRDFMSSGISIDYINPRNNIERESITTDTKTRVTLRRTTDGFTGIIDFGKSGITLTIDVKATENGLTLHIPNDQIKEEGNNRLSSVYAYPFLGAVRQNEIPGYVFLPDGTGALIRFKESGALTQVEFDKRVYGIDLGIEERTLLGTNVRPEEPILFPVFGIVHGVDQQAFMSRIIEGAGYSSIHALPSSSRVAYTHAYPELHYRFTYAQPTSRTKTVQASQKERQKNDFTLSYTFLRHEEANYVGMAKRYQRDLILEGKLAKRNEARTNVPMRLEFFGAERTKGLFFDQKVVMTTVPQMRRIIDELTKEGLTDLEIVYRGWSKGGMTGTSPNYFPIEKALGSRGAWHELVEDYKDLNFLLYLDYMRAYEGAGGYKRSNDIAQKLNTRIIELRDAGGTYRLLKPRATKRIFEEDLIDLDRYAPDGIALAEIGQRLFSDYQEGVVDREEAMGLYQAMLEETDYKVALYRTQDYLLGQIDRYYDVPLYSSQLMIFDDTVPFVPIVLKGYLEGYGPYGNFFANTQDSLLRMIDFGLYPSFILTHEPSYELLGTASEELYSTEYRTWATEIKRQYGLMNEALSPFLEASITSRRVIAPGVVEVFYDNGKGLLINYTFKDYNHEGITVPKQNYVKVGEGYATNE